jgi:translocation and assembly module TamB
MKGDPLTAASLADLALVDDNGPWLRANDVRLEWDATKLLSGQLDIKAIDVASIHVLRRPVTDRARQRDSGTNETQFSLGRLTVKELKLEPDVLGPAASFAVTGAAVRAKDLSGHAELLFAPISGPGDRIDAHAEWTADSNLTGAIKATGPTGGAIATLIQAPPAADVDLDGKVSGTLTHFTADATLAFAGAPTAKIHVQRNGAPIDLTAELHAGKWPLFDVVTRRTGEDLQLAAHAELLEDKPIPVAASLTAPAGKVDATFHYSSGPISIDGLHIEATDLDLARVTEKQIGGKLTARGDVNFGVLLTPDFTWTGDAAIDAFEFPNGRAQRATVKLVLAKRGDAISWTASQGEAAAVRIDALKDLKPARYEFSSTGDVNLTTELVTLSRVQLRGDTLSAAANGRYDIKGGALKLEGLADVAKLSQLSPFAGMARGNWTVERASPQAPWRITANAAGRNVGSSDAVLARLAGPTPAVKLSALFDDGRFSIESGDFLGAGVEAHMTGRVSDKGAIAAHALGRLRRPLDLGGAKLNALSFDAEISGKSSAPVIDAHVSNGAALVAGLQLSGVTGAGRIALGDKPVGNLGLAGVAEGQPLTVRANIAGDKGAWTLTNSQLKLGALQFDAPRIAVDKAGAIDAAWTARGPLAGLYGIEDGTLAAKGTIRTTKTDTAVESSGTVTNFHRGAVLIETATFTAASHNGDVTLDSRIRGDVGATVDLTIKAHGANDPKLALWTGDATLTGQLDRTPLATPQPIKWTYGASGWTVDGGVTGLGGRVDAKASVAANEAAAELKVGSIDVSALTRLARTTSFVGELSGNATFHNANGRATADIVADVTDMNPAGITADPVKVHLTGKLADNRLTGDLTGAGQGFSLTASSQLRVTTGQGFDVAPDMNAPLEAGFSLDGHAEQLWAIFGPEGQALRGHVIAKVAASGTLASPSLQGDFSVADGAYEHGETGLKLYRIASAGQFNQRSLKIVSLSADDGANGTITGAGEITWEKGLDGAIQFKANDLHALAREDRNAMVSGSGALTLDPDAVRIKGEMTVQQARISVEQPASAAIPTLQAVRRENFPGRQRNRPNAAAPATPDRPVLLDMKVTAPRRVVVFGRGLDTEWSTDFQVTGPISDPVVHGTATLVRGDLDLAGRRFAFDAGSLRFDGPIRSSRIDISATRTATDIDATVRITGTPVAPKFTLESTPALPQDEILARVLFGRSASQLSALEAAQLAAGLAQLAGGQAGFDPAGLLRQATGLDRVAVGASGGVATVQAGKYLADNVYIQLGAGGVGGAGAEVEWEPRPGLSITSGAQANGDSRIGVRWKKDFGKPPAPQTSPTPTPAPAQPSAPATGTAPQQK